MRAQLSAPRLAGREAQEGTVSPSSRQGATRVPAFPASRIQPRPCSGQRDACKLDESRGWKTHICVSPCPPVRLPLVRNHTWPAGGRQTTATPSRPRPSCSRSSRNAQLTSVLTGNRNGGCLRPLNLEPVCYTARANGYKYHPHFTEEKTQSLRGRNLCPQLVRNELQRESGLSSGAGGRALLSASACTLSGGLPVCACVRHPLPCHPPPRAAGASQGSHG